MTVWAERGLSPLHALVVATGLLIGLVAGLEPLYAVVAAVGLGLVAVALSELAAGVALLATVSFLESVSLGPGVSLAKLTGGLLVVSWLALLMARPDQEQDFTATHPSVTYLLLVFTGWVAVSTTWAEDSGAVYDTLFRYVLNLMLLLIVFSALRTKRHVVWVLTGFVVGAGVSAAYGLIVPSGPTEVGTRLSGVGINPNESAALLVAAAVLAAALAATLRDRPALRVGAAIGVLACTYGVILTVSRGGLVALAAALIAAVVMAGRWRPVILALAVAAVVATVGYFGVVASPEARTRVTSVAEGGGTGRVDIWRIAWRMVEAEPLHGVGSGNFQQSSVHYLLQPGAIERADFIVDNPKVAHNTYLEVLAELGIVGLVVFIGIIGFSLRCTVRAVGTFRRVGDEHMELISRALFVALVGLLVAAFFGSRQYQNQLWLLLSVGPALWAIARTPTIDANGVRAAT